MTADTYTSTIGALLMGTGNDPNSWGGNANSYVFQILEDAIANTLYSNITGGTLDLSGNAPPLGPSQARYFGLGFSGTLASNQVVKVPNLQKLWVVINQTTGAFTLTFQVAGGGTSIAIPQNNGYQIVQVDPFGNVFVWPFNTNQIQMPDGSASAPAYSDVNETNSGWYRHGTQDWRLSINGSDVFQVTGAGAGSPSVVNVLSPNVLELNGVVANFQTQNQDYAVDTGTANAYACTLSPALVTPVTGMPIRVNIQNANTGASTLNPGPGALSIVNPDGTALKPGQLYPGVYEFQYNGSSSYILVSQSNLSAFTNQLLTVSSNYVVLSTDKYKTINITGTSQVTLTFNSPSGYSGDHFNIVYNSSSRMATIAMSGATSLKLWPGQSAAISNASGAAWLSPAEIRYKTNAPLYADSTYGTSANDGLAATTGASATLNQMFTTLTTHFDTLGQWSLNPSGTFTELVQFEAGPVGGYGTGTIGFSNSYTWNSASGACLTHGDYMILIMYNTNFVGSVTTDIAINMHQSGVIDFGLGTTTGGSFGAGFSGGGHVGLDHGGAVFNVNYNYSITGGTGIHLNCGPDCNVNFAGGIVVTISGSPTISYFMSGLNASIIFDGTVTFSGSPAAGTAPYSVDGLSVLRLAGTTLPGSASPSSGHGSQVY